MLSILAQRESWRQIAISFGFSVLLSVITVSRMDSTGSANEAVLTIVFSMGLGLLALGFASLRFESALHRFLPPAFAILLPASIVGFIFLGEHSIVSGVAMGIGIACGYECWGRFFTLASNGVSTWSVILMMALWGIEVPLIASTGSFAERNMALLGLVLVGLVMLALAIRWYGWGASDAHTEEAYLSEDPKKRSSSEIVSTATKTLWQPILCVAILGFTSGVFRVLLPGIGMDMLVINMVRFGCTVVAMLFAIYIQIARKGDIDFANLFFFSLIIVASAFLLSPFVDHRYQILLLGAIDCIYMLMMFYLIKMCSMSARRNSIPAYLTFGLADGIVSLAVGISYCIGVYVNHSSETLGSAFDLSLLALYALIIILVVQSRKSKREKTKDGKRIVQVIIGYPEEALRENEILRGKYQVTDREMDVLVLALGGRNAHGIAQMLFVSENTVRTHLKRIYRKLDVHSKEELHRLVSDIVET